MASFEFSRIFLALLSWIYGGENCRQMEDIGRFAYFVRWVSISNSFLSAICVEKMRNSRADGHMPSKKIYRSPRKDRKWKAAGDSIYLSGAFDSFGIVTLAVRYRN